MRARFGSRLKQLRQVAGLSQAELARMAGLSDRFLGRMERGLASPSFDTTLALAKALNTTPDQLFIAAEGDGGHAVLRNLHRSMASQREAERGQAFAQGDEGWALLDDGQRRLLAALLKSFSGTTIKCVDASMRLRWLVSSDPAVNGRMSKASGGRCYAMMHGLDAPCPGCQLPLSLTTGAPQEGEVTTKAGQTFLTKTMPIAGADGKVFAALHLAMDITPRTHMEEALLRTQTRLEHILASGPAVLRSCPPDDPFRPVYISENLGALFGFRTSDMLESSTYWMSHVHPEDAQRVAQAQDRLNAEHRLSQEYRIRHADGVWRWVRDDQRLITDRDGQPLEIVGAWQDITDTKASEIVLRASESRYRKLFMTNPTVQMLIDGETGAILDANPAAHAFYGYPAEVLHSMNIADINQLEPAFLTARLNEASSERECVFRFSHKLASGAMRRVEVRVSSLTHGKRTVLHSLIFDVTGEHPQAHENVLTEACKAMLDLASDKMAVLAEDATLVYCTASMAQSLSSTRERLQGAPCPAELLACLHAWQQTVREGLGKTAQSTLGNESVEVEVRPLSNPKQDHCFLLVARNSPQHE